MPESINVGPFAAGKGQKQSGMLAVPGTNIEIPVTIINGTGDGKTMVITGGTHGGEFVGVEAANRLSQLDPPELCGALLIVHAANPPAFFGRMEYRGPLDGKNLHRCYPGKPGGTPTERIAYVIFHEVIKHADFYFDLHGGDLHENLMPFAAYASAGGPETEKKSAEAAGFFGVPMAHKDSTGTSAIEVASRTFGIPAMLGEIGSQGLWTEREVGMYIRGLKNIMKHLGILPGEPEYLCDTRFSDELLDMVNIAATGCWYPCVKTGDVVKKGQKTGEVRDFFGKLVDELYAQRDGTVLYTITALPVQSGEMVMGIG